MGLKQATEDELVAELVVNVLKASPDILSRYFKETQYSYTPRLKSAWQDNVKLLKKVMIAGIFVYFETSFLATIFFCLFLKENNGPFYIYIRSMRPSQRLPQYFKPVRSSLFLVCSP